MVSRGSTVNAVQLENIARPKSGENTTDVI
jgi:hypothetical protein